MATKNGGYAIVKYNDSDIFAKVKNAYENEKPILFYDDDKTCYFIDTTKKVGDDYVLVKGGKTITITDANTVSSTGSADAPTMENIKDLAGHNRFIEGEGRLIAVEGITNNYNKWSLSGTHFMLVLAYVTTDSVSVSSATVFAQYSLPTFIIDKIVPVGTSVVDVKNCYLFSGNAYVDSFAVRIAKINATTIQVLGAETKTIATDLAFRIQYDLLIDAD